jgi:hypothetical protein
MAIPCGWHRSPGAWVFCELSSVGRCPPVSGQPRRSVVLPQGATEGTGYLKGHVVSLPSRHLAGSGSTQALHACKVMDTDHVRSHVDLSLSPGPGICDFETGVSLCSPG